MDGIENHGVDGVAEVVEGEEGGFEIFAPIRLKESDDVFEEDERGTFVAFGFENVDEAPECGGFLAREAGHGTGDGEVLAGEGCGVEGDIGDGVWIDFVDVTDDKVFVAKVSGVHFSFVWVDVIGPENFPLLAFERKANQADASEEFTCGQ